jgi:hypothetical protein
MPGRPVDVVVYDRRAAAALLYAAGKDSDAERLLREVPTFTRAGSIGAVLGILAESTPGLDLDDAAMRAFGLSPADLAANQDLMMGFDHFGYSDAAVRFARRTLALNPLDPDAQRLLQNQPGSGASPQVTVPIPHD